MYISYAVWTFEHFLAVLVLKLHGLTFLHNLIHKFQTKPMQICYSQKEITKTKSSTGFAINSDHDFCLAIDS